ncbi:MAG: acyl-CoA dehydrogenase family protein [Rhodoblastus sp.]|uniref:acyl-CoA dehydrogenase family protein n=1 Tax=Rhodoblastus sp. TaxID=1962975 RepID=UPI003F96F5B8
MHFDYPPKAKELQSRLREFMDRHVVPANKIWLREVEAGSAAPRVVEDLKALARSEGLWNLFLPDLHEDEPGTRLTNLEYAPLAEIMGRIQWASEVFNCSAPDTGNMELLHMFGSPEQRKQWLKPLLDGEIRSCFAMTEPDVASSDATNIATVIARDGDDYVINGRKWFITGAAHPRCKVAVVMGVTNPDAEAHRRQSMVLAPMDTPGVEVVRNISVMNHYSPEGHCEVLFRNARTPRSNLLSEEGSGFALAQARLGPGRIHHCMRSIGQSELAFELMCERAQERRAFGKHLHDHGVVTEWIARSRCEIEQARLLVLKTAWLIDTYGAKAARHEISMIKAVVPTVHTNVLNRAIQTFGAMGLSPDTPLANLWTLGRALHIADGPDEVHLRAIGRQEIRKSRETLGAGAAYMTLP